MEGSPWTCASKLTGTGPHGPTLQDLIWEGSYPTYQLPFRSAASTATESAPCWTQSALSLPHHWPVHTLPPPLCPASICPTCVSGWQLILRHTGEAPPAACEFAAARMLFPHCKTVTASRTLIPLVTGPSRIGPFELDMQSAILYHRLLWKVLSASKAVGSVAWRDIAQVIQAQMFNPLYYYTVIF